jgi:hypothetical protein
MLASLDAGDLYSVRSVKDKRLVTDWTFGIFGAGLGKPAGV